MTKTKLIAHLQKEYAAEDYFTGVLGNRNSVVAARPKPSARKAPPVKQRAAKAS